MNNKILVVDDDPITIQLLKLILEPAGFTIIPAENGREALVKIADDMPDAVLLDMMMPIMDGFEFLNELQTNKETEMLPIIVLSTDTQSNSVQRALNLGAKTYLFKPVSRDALIEAIRQAIAS